MKSKLKKCKGCAKESYIWKKGLCKVCHFKTILPKTKPIKSHQNHLNKYSQKQIDRLKKYQIIRDLYFLENPFCEFPGCTSKKITCHHKGGRLSDNLYKNLCSLCEKHHQYVHDNAQWSYENNFLISRIKNKKNEKNL